MILKLKITGLTITEKEDLLRQLEIIKHNVYPDLRVSYSILKHSPNWIEVDQDVEDTEKATFLLKCFQQLHINHKPDTYYDIDENVQLQVSIEHNRIWK